MKKRPLSVTIISWYLIASALFSIVGLSFAMTEQGRRLLARGNAPLSQQQLTIAGIGVVVALVCGIFMLRGKNWARLVYVGWTALALIVSLVTAPLVPTMFVGVAVLAVVFFFLFRPAANGYFSDDQEGEPDDFAPDR